MIAATTLFSYITTVRNLTMPLGRSVARLGSKFCMPGDGEDAIGLDQKREGTGKPDRSASSPRHRVGVAAWDSTPCMFGLGKNNASGADCAGSVWLVGNPECAGINRRVVGDERALQERRTANPSWPRVLWGTSRGVN